MSVANLDKYGLVPFYQPGQIPEVRLDEGESVKALKLR